MGRDLPGRRWCGASTFRDGVGEGASISGGTAAVQELDLSGWGRRAKQEMEGRRARREVDHASGGGGWISDRGTGDRRCDRSCTVRFGIETYPSWFLRRVGL